MNKVYRIIIVVAGLLLTLGGTSSWAGPPNPTASDHQLNTAGGNLALDNTGASSFQNTAFGALALHQNTTGDNNTASGAFALFSNTTGDKNTASGVDALRNNTTACCNTASGSEALRHNTTGVGNTGSGSSALFANTTGSDNTGSGLGALQSNTTGSSNTASGKTALFLNTSGTNNTASGVDALRNNTTGSRNLALGVNAGRNLKSGSNNIYVGHRGAANEEGTMRLGSAPQTRTFIAGIATTALSGTMVLINSSGRLGVPASSARYKRDIEEVGERSEGLRALRPVAFRYKEDQEGLLQYGLIAEEVAGVYPELVTHRATGEVEAVRYQELIPLLLNELQHQQRELTELKAQNAALAARLERVEALAALALR